MPVNDHYNCYSLSVSTLIVRVNRTRLEGIRRYTELDFLLSFAYGLNKFIFYT